MNPRTQPSRNPITRFVALCLATIFCSAAFAANVCPAASAPPNVILLLADDLGYNDLGCYGQEHIKTPNIDRIAKEGIQFTQFYSGQAVCAPARCVLLTGKHTGHAYVRNNGKPKGRAWDAEKMLFPGQHPIPDETVTLAELLKQRGYATAAYGKWGLGYEGSSGDPLKQGFDDFGGFLCQVHAHNHYPRFLWKGGKQVMMPGNDRTLYGKEYSQDCFIEWGKEFIRANKGKPFFLYLPVAIPHLSIQVPEESLAQYKGVIPEQDYEHRNRRYLPHPFPRAGYAAMITHMDKGIGELMNLVEELGLDDNTLIIFTSDNGPARNRLGGSDSVFFESAGPFRGLKASLYEGGIRVPMVARWPGKIKPGLVSHHVSAFWDVLPTVCEVADARVPDGLDGISMVPVLTGKPEKQKEHEYLYWEFPAYGGQQAVRMGDWKGIRQNMFKAKDGKFHTELFNLNKDIGETTDVSAEHPDIVKKIEKIMVDARVPSVLFPMKELDGTIGRQGLGENSAGADEDRRGPGQTRSS